MVAQTDFFRGIGDDLVVLTAALRNASEEVCSDVPLHDSKDVTAKKENSDMDNSLQKEN